MSNKTKSTIIGLVLMILYAGFQWYTGNGDFSGSRSGSGSSTSQKYPSKQEQQKMKANSGDIMYNLQNNKLSYTKHARCRMDCRTISESEVKKILKTGKINTKKSKPYDQPCPSYALEGKTNDGQTVRIVYAACETVTRVITTIDLDKNYKNCHCD